MILDELFGQTERIMILEELLTYWDSFLTVDEIVRMSDVSKKSVECHLQEQLKS